MKFQGKEKHCETPERWFPAGNHSTETHTPQDPYFGNRWLLLLLERVNGR